MTDFKNIFFSSFKNSFPYLAKLLKKHWRVFFSLYAGLVLMSSLAHYFSESSNSNLAVSFLIPLYINFVCLFAIGFFMLFIVPYLFQKMLNENRLDVFLPLPKNFRGFFKENFKPWGRQMSKALCVCYLFSVFLIIPGVIKFFRYVFVSYIVLFNKKSREKGFSSLRHSSEMTKGFMLSFMLISFSLMGLAYPLNVWLSSFKVDAFSVSVVFAFSVDYALNIMVSFFLGVFYHQIYLKKDKSLISSTAPEPFREQPPAAV